MTDLSEIYLGSSVASNIIKAYLGDTVVFERNQSEFITTWKTDNSGDSANDTITLPLLEPARGGVYNFNVDWGDGSDDNITTYNQAETTHTYSTPGTYTVTISGQIASWSFTLTSNNSDPQKLINISNWGTFQPVENQAFKNCSNLDVTATDAPDLSLTTSIEQFFSFCSTLQYNESVNNWDVSGIVDFKNVFNDCLIFNQPLDNWDTSSGQFMQEMFDNCQLFNQPLNTWNVSSVTDFSEMFQDTAFNQDLNSWNTSSALDMSNMFTNSEMAGNISSWNVSNVTTFVRMLQNCINFNSDISGWNVSSGISFQFMFSGCAYFNQPIGNWTTTNMSTSQNILFGCTSFNQDLSNWNVSNVTNFTNAFRLCIISTANYSSMLIAWAIQSVQSGVNMRIDSSYTISTAQASRNTLTNAPNNWTITDLGGV